MFTWVLVFWLQMPENYTRYDQYRTERECRDAEQLWQRRFHIVNSQLQAECRKQ